MQEGWRQVAGKSRLCRRGGSRLQAKERKRYSAEIKQKRACTGCRASHPRWFKWPFGCLARSSSNNLVGAPELVHREPWLGNDEAGGGVEGGGAAVAAPPQRALHARCQTKGTLLQGGRAVGASAVQNEANRHTIIGQAVGKAACGAMLQ